jgi:probable phosphoglycerate mutase
MPRVQLDDHVPTGGFERIEVLPDLRRNGHL